MATKVVPKSDIQRVYSARGFYLYNGTRGNLTGKLEVDINNGRFESLIVDHGSSTPGQMIRGIVRNDGNKTRLEFFKFPLTTGLANLAYKLEKVASGDFSGKYKGKWMALPYKVTFNRDLGIMLATVNPSVCGTGDYAEIILSK